MDQVGDSTDLGPGNALVEVWFKAASAGTTEVSFMGYPPLPTCLPGLILTTEKGVQEIERKHTSTGIIVNSAVFFWSKQVTKPGQIQVVRKTPLLVGSSCRAALQSIQI